MDPQISAGYYGQNTLFQRWRYDTNRLLVDADSAGNVDIRRSTIGYVYTLGGTAVSWGSQLQKIVAHYWNGGYTIRMVAILLKRWLTIGMVAILLE